MFCNPNIFPNPSIFPCLIDYIFNISQVHLGWQSMETFGNGSSLSKKRRRNNRGQRLDKIIANRVQSRPIRFHSYWLKMKMMEWSVNASLLRHSNDVGGPAFRVPRSRRLPWTSFLFSRGAAVVDGSSRTPVATCQNSGYEITALQRPCKVWEHCAELRPCSFFWRPVCFSVSSSKRDKCWHFSSALQRRKKMMALGSWHNVFAFRCRRPSGWTMPFFFWTSAPTSQF